jgi:DNA (cytosine-5)-methyltransferase 1
VIFGSVCSGIEAASVAWHSLGWRASFLSDIDPFARTVLQHHYPEVPLHGDFTSIKEDEYEPIDLLVGGTPCQSFSLAGLRGGMDDERGNLSLEFARLAQRLRPRWIVWENVPGVLSSNGGRDFGSILGALVELGYGISYRVLDAQNFGVPQRRRRVFVVGYLGDYRRAAAVLLEPQSLARHTASRRKTKESFTAFTPSGFAGFSESNIVGTLRGRIAGASGGGETLVAGIEFGVDGGKFVDCATTVDTHARNSPIGNQLSTAVLEYRDHAIAGTLMASGAGMERPAGVGSECDFVIPDVIAFSCKDYGADAGGKAPTMRAMEFDKSHINGGGQIAIAYQDNAESAKQGLVVRRLTPIECERLQGFPDNYTLIPWDPTGKRNSMAPDTLRYRALGNSMATPVMKWIGQRIELVDNLNFY